jgi:hypothetical protein
MMGKGGMGFVSFSCSAWVLTVFLLLFLFHGTGRARSIDGREGSGWFLDMSLFSSSAHGKLTCEECHGPMDDQPGGHPIPGSTWVLKNLPQGRYDYARCQRCHRESYERYLSGAHAEALKKQRKDSDKGASDLAWEKQAPTCGHCHSSHYQKARQGRLEAGREMVSNCGQCHPIQKKTYLGGFHGKTAANLGDALSAFCSDCHGAHRCLSLKDRKAALDACLKCHPKADLSFASFLIHPAGEKGDREREKAVSLISIVSALMGIFVTLVVVFFYGHSLLWLLREIHEKLRRRRP